MDTDRVGDPLDPDATLDGHEAGPMIRPAVALWVARVAFHYVVRVVAVATYRSLDR